MIRVGLHGYFSDGKTTADKIQGFFQLIHKDGGGPSSHIDAAEVISIFLVKQYFPPECGKILPATPLFENKTVKGTVWAESFTKRYMKVKKTRLA
jgi:hypothetical protein